MTPTQPSIRSLIQEARAVIALDPKRLQRALTRYVAAHAASTGALLLSLYLLIPIIRSVGGVQESWLTYPIPAVPGGAESITLHWTVPFVTLFLATWLMTRAKRIEFGLWRVGADVARKHLATESGGDEREDAGLAHVERTGKAVAVLVRWYGLLAANAVRLTGIALFMAVAHPMTLAVLASVALLVTALYRWNVAMRIRRATPREGNLVEPMIDHRVAIADAGSAYSLVAPATVLIVLVVNRLAPIAHVDPIDVTELLVSYAVSAAFAHALADVAQTHLRMAGRPDAQLAMIERLTGGSKGVAGASFAVERTDFVESEDGWAIRVPRRGDAKR